MVVVLRESLKYFITGLSTLEEAIELHIVRVEIYAMHEGCVAILRKARGRVHFCRSLPRRSSGHWKIQGCSVRIFQKDISTVINGSGSDE